VALEPLGNAAASAASERRLGGWAGLAPCPRSPAGPVGFHGGAGRPFVNRDSAGEFQWMQARRVSLCYLAAGLRARPGLSTLKNSWGLARRVS
jgi:hypothetical protein